MDSFSKVSYNSNIAKKKLTKNKFTDLKLRIAKKMEAEAAKSGKNKPVSQENQQKITLDKAKSIIDKELNNDNLMIKIIDNNTVYDCLDDFFYKCGDFDLTNDDKEDENYNEIERNINETHNGFFTKFKNFKNNTRKGLLKSITPSMGFIKASSELMVVPNPIGLITKNRDPTTVNLK